MVRSMYPVVASSAAMSGRQRNSFTSNSSNQVGPTFGTQGTAISGQRMSGERSGNQCQGDAMSTEELPEEPTSTEAVHSLRGEKNGRNVSRGTIDLNSLRSEERRV